MEESTADIMINVKKSEEGSPKLSDKDDKNFSTKDCKTIENANY